MALAVNQSGLAATKTVVLLTPEETDAATKKSVPYRGPGSLASHWRTFVLRPPVFALGAARRAHWTTFVRRTQASPGRPGGLRPGSTLLANVGARRWRVSACS